MAVAADLELAAAEAFLEDFEAIADAVNIIYFRMCYEE